MKYQFILLIVFCFTITSCDQEIKESKVPSVVKNTLTARHPMSANIEWEKDGSTYEAEFDWHGRETSVKIEDAGRYVMEKQELAQQELPPAVLSSVRSSYKDYVIEETEKLVTKGITYYQVELEAKGKEEIRLVLSDNGAPANGISYWD